ncbi:hypothetical protein [Nocardia caishijiensis]|uniref:Uncharacterized protein n=1 Tax=Nocardia caishijiensis TaxID=184756 RepID=A0ABQ6YLU6_9NOCA|nr:hypothetical protein [Nocardia caishijiensis]KAF0846762.1 hypothetical protein FNL39_104184 [Nocardia caishijiensis]
MSIPYRPPRRVSAGTAELALPRTIGTEMASGSSCSDEPNGLTYRQAREMLRQHDIHGPQCRQWLAAAAYLSAGLDDE